MKFANLRVETAPIAGCAFLAASVSPFRAPCLRAVAIA